MGKQFLEGAISGVLTCIISVKTQNGRSLGRGYFPGQGHVVFGQGGPQRSDRRPQSGLDQGDDVHLAFDKKERIGLVDEGAGVPVLFGLSEPLDATEKFTGALARGRPWESLTITRNG